MQHFTMHGGQASLEKQVMAPQAGTHEATHHTSRHPDGTLVPLMKEVEIVSVAVTWQSVP